MALSYVAAGTGAAVSATSTGALGIPAGIANNDILILGAHSRTNAAHSISGGTGWAEVVAQAGSTNGGRLSVWWKRTTGTESPAPTVNYTGTAESFAAQLWAFRGALLSGSPFDVLGTALDIASSATYTGSALTTNYANSMCLFVVGCMDNSTFTVSSGLITNSVGTTNANGTDNSIYVGYDNTAAGTSIGLQAAPVMTKDLQSDAGRGLTFFLREEPSTVSHKLLSCLGVG